MPWANASNTPFRLFKSFVHEGGISTPFVVHWPAGMMSVAQSTTVDNESEDVTSYGRICHSPWILMDIVATCCDLAGVPVDTNKIEGESFLNVLHGNNDTKRSTPIFWEHQGNCAVRQGKWKLVYRRGNKDEECQNDSWELYDMNKDRTELNNIAALNEERVKNMARLWFDWATRVGVKPWPLKPLPEGEKDWSNLPWLW